MTEARGRLAAGALSLCAVFIAYQSLAAGGVWVCGGPVLRLPAHVSRGDLLANVAAYVPFGALAVMTFTRRVTRVASLGAITGAVVLGALLSTTLELVQSCQAARVSSAIDVAANALGALAGAVLAALLLTVAPTVFRDRTTRWRGQRLPLVTLAVPALWIVSQTLPWVFSLDVGVARANLSFLRRWAETPHVDPWTVARHASAWLAIGCACRLVAGTPWTSLSLLLSTMVVCVGAQVLTRGPVPLSFGELAGMALALVVLVPAFLRRGRATRVTPWATGLAIAALSAVAVYEVEPGASPGTSAFRWWPQVGLGRPLDAVDFAILFGWLGVAVTVAAHWRDSEDDAQARRSWPIVAVLATVALEVAQVAIPGRGPDLSPPFLTALAALGAAVILRDDR